MLGNHSAFDDCPWLTNITWDRHEVTENALHNLTFVCPFIDNNSDVTEIERKLENPATFFVQVVRLILPLLLIIILIIFYNSVTVLSRTVLSIALCSIYWIVVFSLLAIKALVFVVLVPVVVKSDDYEELCHINEAGFVAVISLQCAADFMTFMALDHEQKFRSSDYATIPGSPYSNSCLPMTWRNIACSWYRVVVAMATVLPLVLLASVEILFELSKHAPPSISPVLVWLFIFSLFLPRICVFLMIIRMLFLKGSLRLTVIARFYLVAAFVLSITDNLPSSVTNIAPYAHSTNSCPNPCKLDVLTVFDLSQLLGAVSLILYTLFIRSQFLRIEQECKHAMVWGIQRDIDFHGSTEPLHHRSP